MQTARRRFQSAVDSSAPIREEALKDLRFRTGDQWDAKAKQTRDLENRPCLTINRIPQFIDHIANEQRQSRPSLIVSSAGGIGNDPNEEYLRLSAEIWQGLMRHIEQRSDAECAYDTAFKAAVGDSFGWWEITSEYAADDTFDQELRIKRILDAFAVYEDIAATEPDRSDMNWAFVTSQVGREEYRAKYGTSLMAARGFFDSLGESPGPNWVAEDYVTLAKYWVRTYKKRRLYSLVTSSQRAVELIHKFKKLKLAKPDAAGEVHFTAFEEEIASALNVESQDGTIQKPALPEGVRQVTDKKGNSIVRFVSWPEVNWYIINGVEVLDKGSWPGRWIPLIPCLGEEVMVQGRRQLISLTRFIRDSQALYNFFRSQQAEVIALTPKAPFIGPVGAFKTHQSRWTNANKTTYAYLEYDVITLPNGQPAPPPQRNAVEPPIVAINQAVMQANDDLKAGTGIYDPSLGQQSNETSGIAINARQQAAETANFHFVDNFRRSMRHEGRILMDLIPHYYDRADRLVRIVKPDNTHELVMINGMTDYKGKSLFFDPQVGQYDVEVETGPSFQSKQQQVFDLLTKMVQANPSIWQTHGDLLWRAAPLPGALGLDAAERAKAMLPPPIQAIANGQKPPDPIAEAKMQQMGMMIQHLSSMVQTLSDTIKTKKLELASKERIALFQGEVNLLAAELKAGLASAETAAQLDMQQMQDRLQKLHEQMTQQQELDADSAEAEADRQHQLQLAQMQQQQQPPAQAA